MLRSSLRDVRSITLVFLLVLLALSVACQSPRTSGAADATVLGRLDDEWSKAVGAKDVEKTMSYYADDALMMLPNIPTGRSTGSSANCQFCTFTGDFFAP